MAVEPPKLVEGSRVRLKGIRAPTTVRRIISGELLEVELVEGVKRYWLNARKRGEGEESPDDAPDLSPEEAERARQRRMMRDRLEGSA